MKTIEEASTHKSAKTHADNVFFVTRDIERWPFGPKITGFRGLFLEHLCVKFDDPRLDASHFSYRAENRQTDSQTEVKTLPLQCCRRG